MEEFEEEEYDSEYDDEDEDDGSLDSQGNKKKKKKRRGLDPAKTQKQLDMLEELAMQMKLQKEAIEAEQKKLKLQQLKLVKDKAK